MSNVLELVNIRKSFGAELVLNDLSLTVPEHLVQENQLCCAVSTCLNQLMMGRFF